MVEFVWLRADRHARAGFGLKAKPTGLLVRGIGLKFPPLSFIFLFRWNFIFIILCLCSIVVLRDIGNVEVEGANPSRGFIKLLKMKFILNIFKDTIKLFSLALIILSVIFLTFFILKKIPSLVFWIFIAVAGLFANVVLPKIRK